MKRIILALCLNLFLFLSPCSAEITSTVIFDWSSLSIEFTPYSGGNGTNSYSWLDSYGSLSADATTADPFETDSMLVDEDGHTSSFSVSATTSLASSSAARFTTDAPNPMTTLTAIASTQSSLSGAQDEYQYSSAFADNFGSLSLEGDGVFLFSVNWEMTLEGDLGDSANYTLGSVYMGVEVADYGDPDYSSSFTTLQRESDIDGAGSYAGTLRVAFANQGENEAWFYGGAEAFSNSQNVPEPASFTLLLCGLGCLIWIGRRRCR